MTNKKEISQLLRTKGKFRGNILKTDASYLMEKYGREGIIKAEEEMKKLGVDIKYNEIESAKLYPIGWRAISLIAIKKAFKLDKKGLSDMGYSAPRNSFLVKVVLQYFASVEKTFIEMGKYWGKHYTVGKLENKEIDLDKKYVEFDLINFKLHPYFCIYFQGYCKSIAEMILKGEEVKAREKKCIFKGDPCDKIVITWK